MKSCSTSSLVYGGYIARMLNSRGRAIVGHSETRLQNFRAGSDCTCRVVANLRTYDSARTTSKPRFRQKRCRTPPALPSQATVTARSGQLFPLQQIPLLRDDQHCAKLVRANLVKADVDSQFQRTHQIESAPDK